MEIEFPDVLDSTLMATYKSCPNLFFKSHIEHYKPRGQSVHLHAGAAFAKGLEVARVAFFVEHKSAEEAIARGLNALMIFYGDFECPTDSAKSCNRMMGALEYYFEQWPLHLDPATPTVLPGGKHGIEFSFAHPLPILHPETGNPLIYCGRMDQLVDFAGGIYIEDDKTTSSLGPTWARQWDLRSQFTGYTWGCREAGIKTNGILIRGVSILKTKYDKAEAVTYRPDWQVERWFEETCETIQEMIEAWNKKKWKHNLDHACADYGGCQFRVACSSQDESPWLNQYFERRKWNPITREETLLESPAIDPAGKDMIRDVLRTNMDNILDQNL